MQVVRGAVCFERPDFHFAEALSAELRLAAQRLLRYQRVRTGRARVNLVFDEVDELHHVDVADRDGLVELLAGAPVVQDGLAERGRGELFLAVQAQRLFLHVVQRHLRHIARQILALRLFAQPSL